MSVIIIGAGFAGSACAWWLSRYGVRDVIVLEKEEMPGIHSSGLNAGLARRYEEDPVVAPLAAEGVDFILDPPEDFVEGKLIEQNGSLLLNPLNIPDDTRHRIIAKEEALSMVPLLKDALFNRALWTDTDGIVDIHKYLWSFINGAKEKGVKFLNEHEIRKFVVKGKRIVDVVTSRGSFSADAVVNAAGAWVQQLADIAGAEDLKIKPLRRHLFCTPPMKDVDPKWPMVWDMENQYYFRPESGGLLLGACDEEEVPPGAPCTNPMIREMLAEKLTKFCPSLSNISIAREWCGCRTFAPDRRPVVRFDRKIGNFYWLAALGGRGMTCASAAGRIAAEEVRKFMNA